MPNKKPPPFFLRFAIAFPRKIMKAHREERLRKMETDPEFRKKMEKREADIEKIALFNDSIQTKTK
jgi:hypothetical protein